MRRFPRNPNWKQSLIERKLRRCTNHAERKAAVSLLRSQGHVRRFPNSLPKWKQLLTERELRKDGITRQKICSSYPEDGMCRKSTRLDRVVFGRFRNLHELLALRTSPTMAVEVRPKRIELLPLQAGSCSEERQYRHETPHFVRWKERALVCKGITSKQQPGSVSEWRSASI